MRATNFFRSMYVMYVAFAFHIPGMHARWCWWLWCCMCVLLCYAVLLCARHGGCLCLHIVLYTFCNSMLFNEIFQLFDWGRDWSLTDCLTECLSSILGEEFQKQKPHLLSCLLSLTFIWLSPVVSALWLVYFYIFGGKNSNRRSFT